MAIEAPPPAAPAAPTFVGAPPPPRGRKRKLGETVDNPISLDSPAPTPAKPNTQRGKAKAEPNARNVDLTAAEDGDDDTYVERMFTGGDVGGSASKSRAKGKEKQKVGGEEQKRPRRFRAKAPNSYHAILDRAMTQRYVPRFIPLIPFHRDKHSPYSINSMFVIDRTRNDDADCPTETLSIAGTTGNIYTINIGPVPSCNCPHALKGNQCKHIIYAMVRVLHAPANLQYQLGLLKSELRTVFAQAPPIPTADANVKESDGKRKAIADDDDCPICCMPFIENGKANLDEIVYCKAACGNNVHRECFELWAATKKGACGGVTCPFCRTIWQGDEDMVKKVAQTGAKNAEGYVNVASQLGLSGRRDYSTYHSFWVRREARRGVDVGDYYYDDFLYD
jgi:hypothetical protein